MHINIKELEPLTYTYNSNLNVSNFNTLIDLTKQFTNNTQNNINDCIAIKMPDYICVVSQ